ncbi:hypothetical protein BASA50_009709 [Batrachochytrium salamandrivorans]|uniref:Histone chaperone domain-containing protein n=1 Tax=Batrachochytrium salamandrivorans TaxID=1357716 RepID=A0ABQ8F0N2_9FUNG|nr:hypothetical protein BASA62_004636 [Batrachochytrium salamandrivorans]KAH6571007.1 hypothetical protein BASA60_007437 [Batrachochytrium salamandrivorans]KAH6590007.1 hypothetical protein BASA50_009709 [Batrachochytrium salamandrivorans]KAH6592287.1 hypothetical protein BASA61_004610 [Batrachochytrium salamandrivorans]KAH9270098.1 hypothetical protein BASA83_007773 [Batrachochytrium salamandrivorans]
MNPTASNSNPTGKADMQFAEILAPSAVVQPTPRDKGKQPMVDVAASGDERDARQHTQPATAKKDNLESAGADDDSAESDDSGDYMLDSDDEGSENSTDMDTDASDEDMYDDELDQQEELAGLLEEAAENGDGTGMVQGLRSGNSLHNPHARHSSRLGDGGASGSGFRTDDTNHEDKSISTNK